MKEDFCVNANYTGPYTKRQAEELLAEHLEIAYGVKYEKRKCLRCDTCGKVNLGTYYTDNPSTMENPALPEYVWYAKAGSVLCPDCYADLVAKVICDWIETKETGK